MSGYLVKSAALGAYDALSLSPCTRREIFRAALLVLWAVVSDHAPVPGPAPVRVPFLPMPTRTVSRLARPRLVRRGWRVYLARSVSVTDFVGYPTVCAYAVWSPRGWRRLWVL